MITIPSRAFGAIDRQEPEYAELDAELDAEHKQWVSMLNYKPEQMSAEDQSMWDAVNARRLAEKNKHVHPTFRNVLKMFG